MKIANLLQALANRGLNFYILGSPEVEINRVVINSRCVQPGVLFVAITGKLFDGHTYLRQAVKNGAVALVVKKFDPKITSILQIKVANTRLALACIIDEFANSPTKNLTLVGITGTNGKTTVSYLVESILSCFGLVGIIGTMGVCYGNVHRETDMTTPESVKLATIFAEMHSVGVTQVVMEVSSHALDQYRVDGCLFNVAVFTNLSRDHLDYHHDIISYFKAKRRLFSDLLPWAKFAGKVPVAIICLDDFYARDLVNLCLLNGIKTLTYGINSMAQIRLIRKILTITGSYCKITWPGGEIDLNTSLVGEYNIQNIMAAIGVGLALGCQSELILKGLKKVKVIPGRLERIIVEDSKSNSPIVFVDYAHTDDALTKVLATLKPLTKGRLICIFGAGGDRDHGKRFLMGQAVAKGADFAVITNDNPRSENPIDIISMIEAGLKQYGFRRIKYLTHNIKHGYLIEPNRAIAIALTINQAQCDDVVLVAGKGHETYQIIAKKKLPFNDREQVIQALVCRSNQFVKN